MITSLILMSVGLFTQLISFILPVWQVWPTAFLTGLTYFFSALANFNFIFPIDTLFDVISFLLFFEVSFFSAKLILKIFNYARGVGSGLDI